MDLYERIARALDWPVEEVRRFSLQSLRDLVRPVDPKLAEEMTRAIALGSYIVENRKSFDVRKVFVALGRPRVVPSMDALKKGIETELEHTDDPVLAGKIALDHFKEFPDYYERLEVMEERAKKGLPPNPKLVNNGEAGLGLGDWEAVGESAWRLQVGTERYVIVRQVRRRLRARAPWREGYVLGVARAGRGMSQALGEPQWIDADDLHEARDVDLVKWSSTPGDATEVARRHMARRTAKTVMANGCEMPRVVAAFDRCFEIVRVQFPDFGDVELHQDESGANDQGFGSERQFGYCMDGKPIRIAFASKTEKLPQVNIDGLVAHEWGHALDFRYGDDLGELLGRRLPDGAERRADTIAREVFGKTIKYDAKDVQCVRCRGQAPRPRRLGA